jgi:hypothetical protein
MLAVIISSLALLLTGVHNYRTNVRMERQDAAIQHIQMRENHDRDALRICADSTASKQDCRDIIGAYGSLEENFARATP